MATLPHGPDREGPIFDVGGAEEELLPVHEPCHGRRRHRVEDEHRVVHEEHRGDQEHAHADAR